LLLGFVLGPLLEENLRRAMILGRGDATVFLTRPISATLLALTVIVLVVVLMPSVGKKRAEVFSESD
jgi:TctA family transporter